MPLVAAEQPTNKGAVAKWEILNIDQTGHAGVTDVTATCFNQTMVKMVH
jgi:hypothetical protein